MKNLLNELNDNTGVGALNAKVNEITVGLMGAHVEGKTNHFKDDLYTVLLQKKAKGRNLPESVNNINYIRAMAEELSSKLPKEWISKPAKVGTGGATEGLIILYLTEEGQKNYIKARMY